MQSSHWPAARAIYVPGLRHGLCVQCWFLFAGPSGQRSTSKFRVWELGSINHRRGCSFSPSVAEIFPCPDSPSSSFELSWIEMCFSLLAEPSGKTLLKSLYQNWNAGFFLFCFCCLAKMKTRFSSSRTGQTATCTIWKMLNCADECLQLDQFIEIITSSRDFINL